VLHVSTTAAFLVGIAVAVVVLPVVLGGAPRN
jgi:hypothetical protein